jgi:hypothetical protein
MIKPVPQYNIIQEDINPAAFNISSMKIDRVMMGTFTNNLSKQISNSKTPVKAASPPTKARKF